MRSTDSVWHAVRPGLKADVEHVIKAGQILRVENISLTIPQQQENAVGDHIAAPVGIDNVLAVLKVLHGAVHIGLNGLGGMLHLTVHILIEGALRHRVYDQIENTEQRQKYHEQKQHIPQAALQQEGFSIHRARCRR